MLESIKNPKKKSDQLMNDLANMTSMSARVLCGGS